MASFAIRRAVRADLVSIIQLLADDSLGAQREDVRLPLDAGYTAAFEAIDADPNQFLAVAADGAQIVGTLQLTFIAGLSRKGALRGQIEAVRVAAHLRGRGMGQELIEWAIEECRARGCQIVQLTSDNSRSDAHRFYERLGFAATHVGYKLSL